MKTYPKTNPYDSAFIRTTGSIATPTDGLTKLEYFSALAMQGLIAKGDIDLICITAKEAVNHAIALIDELNKKQEEIK